MQVLCEYDGADKHHPTDHPKLLTYRKINSLNPKRHRSDSHCITSTPPRLPSPTPISIHHTLEQKTSIKPSYMFERHVCAWTTRRLNVTNLFSLQGGDRVPQAVKAVFDVVPTLALQRIVVCPFVCLQ